MTNVLEWHNADRTGWPDGPWSGEPDKIQWVDEATGLDCLMHRAGHAGHWCGYVGVAEGHPFFGVGYSRCPQSPACEEPWCEHAPENVVSVHGGLTYANFCQVHPDGTEHPEEGVCHVPFAGRPHRVWWLGFDCAHCYDLSPASERLLPVALRSGGTYRDRPYVEAQVRRLAGQLAAMAA